MENEQAKQVQTVGVPQKQQRGRRIRRLIFCSLAAILILVLIATYFLGYWYVGPKKPAQSVVVSSRVCGEAIINDFNTKTQDISYPMSDADKAGFNALKQKIISLSDNEDDPTCQTILFQIAYTSMDVPAMDAAFKHVKASHDRGSYADSNLLAGYHPNTMESFMNDARGGQ